MSGRPRARVVVSACLLGERVRWDGGERRQPWLASLSSAGVELLPVCPEVGVGMGVPREPIQLVADDDGSRARGVQSGRDWTAALRAWAAATLDDLEARGPLAGAVLKARSPSCGLVVPVFGAGGEAQVDAASGLFAAAVRARGLPLVDEAALEDPARRDAFLVRAFTRARLLALATGDDLVAFHAEHRALLGWLAPRCGRFEALAAARDLPAYRAALLGALAADPP